MKKSTRNILLGVAVLCIVLVIFFIQHFKTGSTVNNEFQSVALGSEVGNSSRLQYKENHYSRAVELVSPEVYHNTDGQPIFLRDHIGREVILLDIWTYSCINCQRTLPYIEGWYEKYKEDGLLVIGIHSPEFEFEKDQANVARAISKFNLTYPVVQDNDMQIWRSYRNQYWPRKYLIDIDGFVVYDHIGEGGYDETEVVIQKLLDERREVLGMNGSEGGVRDGMVSDTIAKSVTQVSTPEIYLGYEFSRAQMGNIEGWHPAQTVDFLGVMKRDKNKFYLNGLWRNNADNMESVGSNSTLSLRYGARQVNIVASADTMVEAVIYLDGVEYGKVAIKDSGLYTLVDLPMYGEHEIEIRTMSPGVKVYTFTFG